MTWQLSEVAVYGAGNIRRVGLRPNELNVITGRSQRGKSTILEIVDYCLLSGSCRIPKGDVRDALDAVGVLLRDGEGRTLGIVRGLPVAGKQTRSNCWLEQGIEALPDTQPQDNQSLETAKEELSGFTRIESIELLSRDGDEDEKSAVNIRHCAPFLFQHQDVIANRNLTFAGLADHWARRHALEAIGYFLGAITIEQMEKRNRLLSLQAQLASELRRAAEIRRLSAGGFDRGAALWQESRVLGLVAGELPSTLSRLRLALERVADWSGGPSLPDMAGELQQAQHQERELIRSVESLRRERDSTRRYLRLSEDTSNLARAGQRRLSVRALLPQPEEGDCPVCGGVLPHEAWQQQLVLAEEALQAEATIDPRVESRLERLVQRTERELELATSQLEVIRQQISALRRAIAARQTGAEQEAERLRLVGRVQEYLRAMGGALVQSETDVSALQKSISELEGEVGDIAMRRRVDVVEAVVAKATTTYATALKTEFGASEVRVRLRDMTIQVKVSGRWTSLSELGSGANWVSYHVAACLGLHQGFMAGRGPVPRILLLDQPSQAWFPPERIATDGGVEPRASADKVSVRRLYEVLNTFCGDTGLQILVVDHARPDLPWFKARTRQDWHEEGGLVPEDWMDERLL